MTSQQALLLVGLFVWFFLLIFGQSLASAVRARFRKPKTPKTTPNHARLIAKPGATLDLVGEDGVVRAKVVLDRLTFSSHDGTTVGFVDYFHYWQRHRL